MLPELNLRDFHGCLESHFGWYLPSVQHLPLPQRLEEAFSEAWGDAAMWWTDPILKAMHPGAVFGIFYWEGGPIVTDGFAYLKISDLRLVGELRAAILHAVPDALPSAVYAIAPYPDPNATPAAMVLTSEDDWSAAVEFKVGLRELRKKRF